MWEVAYRDVDLVPALQGPMQGVAEHLDAYRDAIAARWPLPSAQRTALCATLTLAVRFGTWRTLADAGLDAAAMATLVVGWVDAVARSGQP
jgi:hypothetical protein